MKWCRVENNVVMEVEQFTKDPNGVLFHPYLVWESDTTNTAQVGWIFDPVAKTFSAPITPAPTAAQLHQQLITSAQIALDKTDVVAGRCFKAGVPYPATWQTYTMALRNIVNGTDTTSTALPAIPSYPLGT